MCPRTLERSLVRAYEQGRRGLGEIRAAVRKYAALRGEDYHETGAVAALIKGAQALHAVQSARSRAVPAQDVLRYVRDPDRPVDHRAAVLLTYLFGLRASSLFALKWDDVRTGSSWIRIVVRYLKQEPKGAHHTPEAHGISRDLVLTVQQAGQSVENVLPRKRKETASSALNALLPRGQSSHGLRAGALTSAMALGVPTATLLRHFDWRSASVWPRYVAATDLVDRTAARVFFGHLLPENARREEAKE